MPIITRFAPSPTGYLHIGGARTALFNYLFAKKNKGKFLLRIEDTDKARSSQEATIAILNSLKWLGIDHDGEVIYQSTRESRHREAAYALVKNGKAYLCFSSQEEITKLKDAAIINKEHFIFHSPWRDVNVHEHPKDIKPVIRLKAPKDGVTTVKDLLQGEVVVQNSHLDDMVLLRGDGTPTYMLAVVVDDYDMGITHIIRGDDHLSNASRQQILYEAFGFKIPEMIHIPLIYGPDGTKLSKRHGALGVEDYQKLGYLPESLCNYLLRLGWSHGNDEIINRAQAIEWFNIDGLGKSPSRLDFNKMKYLNAHYLRDKSNEELANIVIAMIEKSHKLTHISKDNILEAMEGLKPRAELITDLVQLSYMYIVDIPLYITDEAKKVIGEIDKNLLDIVTQELKALIQFTKEQIQDKLQKLAEDRGLKLGEIMYFIRPLIAGDIKSPSVFEMMEILGKEQVVQRLKHENSI